MRYVRQYMQKTVRTDDPQLFDEMINSLYLKAATSGKEPEIHYFEGMGFCASVKFFMVQQIAENTKDEFEMIGDYELEKQLDEKYRMYIDELNEGLRIYYEMLKGGLPDGLPKSSV